ncbi:MAG: hypothetical protein ACREAE_07335 [Nitrosopumilaceae archaeon]
MDIDRFNHDEHVMKTMTKETTEKITSVENMTKEKMAETIKSAKREAEYSEKKDTISICDVMKNNTSEIIRKLESQIPTYNQLYSDLYTKYLHMMDDLYSSCYVSEKEFSDKLGMDQKTLGAFDAYWKYVTDLTLNQIELATNFAKMYVQFRLSALDSYDKAVHQMMDNYAKAWTQFNSNKK